MDTTFQAFFDMVHEAFHSNRGVQWRKSISMESVGNWSLQKATRTRHADGVQSTDSADLLADRDILAEEGFRAIL